MKILLSPHMVVLSFLALASGSGCAGDHAESSVGSGGEGGAMAGGEATGGSADTAGTGGAAASGGHGGNAGSAGSGGTGGSGAMGGGPLPADGPVEAGLAADAGDAGKAGEATGSGGAGCGHPMCDGFESFSVGTKPLKPFGIQLTAGNTVAVAGDKAFSGKQSVQIDAAGGVASLTLMVTSLLPSPKKIAYARMMMWLENTPGSGGGGAHWAVISMDGQTRVDNVTYLPHVAYGGRGDNSRFMLYAGPSSTRGAVDCAKQLSPLGIPLKTWSCIEMRIDETANPQYTIKIDGTPVPGFSFNEGTAGSSCVASATGGKWYVPDVSVVRFGWQHTHEQSKPVRMWIDDVVVDEKPIGCPAQ